MKPWVGVHMTAFFEIRYNCETGETFFQFEREGGGEICPEGVGRLSLEKEPISVHYTHTRELKSKNRVGKGWPQELHGGRRPCLDGQTFSSGWSAGFWSPVDMEKYWWRIQGKGMCWPILITSWKSRSQWLYGKMEQEASEDETPGKELVLYESRPRENHSWGGPFMEPYAAMSATVYMYMLLP